MSPVTATPVSLSPVTSTPVAYNLNTSSPVAYIPVITTMSPIIPGQQKPLAYEPVSSPHYHPASSPVEMPVAEDAAVQGASSSLREANYTSTNVGHVHSQPTNAPSSTTAEELDDAATSSTKPRQGFNDDQIVITDDRIDFPVYEYDLG
eukprot:CAMPEP_0202456998 /NCGR_PEP_ID=MMETSP1360-20130828/14124_1 /ASSEMBLY_ACC=CAM_ASM_000848 /TAXON_ID=515479 /ORGANISM="Licmophora paradoxa, Strain CCMP2313" /LENGTH=148 /DNA_ID=CAMNT_0049076965 /DNA_START=1 /DNA_END=443 /DNA_ORIENTATION=+